MRKPRRAQGRPDASGGMPYLREMLARATDLLTRTPQGLYCPLGDFHVDPIRPVPRALITHGHSDHARAGHGRVLATAETLLDHGRALRARISPARQQAVGLGETMRIGDVDVRFTPAGHVLGSAQIAIEAAGTRVVVSGRLQARRGSDLPALRGGALRRLHHRGDVRPAGLPPSRCRGEIGKLLRFRRLVSRARPHRRRLCARQGAAGHGAPARGRATTAPIYLHGAMERLTDLYKREGIALGETPKVARHDRAAPSPARSCSARPRRSRTCGRAVSPTRSPPSPPAGCGCGRGPARSGVELPLVISDHSDWDDLCRTILDTGAGEVWVTHGQEDALVHWCVTRGIAAQAPAPARLWRRRRGRRRRGAGARRRAP